MVRNIIDGFSIHKPLLQDPFDRWDPAGYDAANEYTAGAVGGTAGALTGAGIGAAATAWAGPGAGIGALIGGAIGALGGSTGGYLSGFGNKTWNLKRDASGNISFSPEEGNFVRYNNESGAERELINHVYWDKTNGDTYYLDPDSKKYIKYTGQQLASPGMLKYAADDDLDNIAKDIAQTILSNRLKKQFEEQTKVKDNSSTADAGSGTIASVPIGEVTTGPTLAELDYNTRLAEADAQLQAFLLANQLVDTPKEDNTTYYKYGSNEIDLEYYLHNIGTNLSSYLDSKKWNQLQKDAFMRSYETYKAGLLDLLTNKGNRFYTDDAGLITDSLGQLAGENDRFYIDKEGNTYASLDEIKDKKLKKSAVLFSPNDEVGKYLKTIGRAIVGAGKTKKKDEESEGDFDFVKHGFVNHWVTKINPAGGLTDIDPYLNLDPVGLDGKRLRTNRTKYLANELSLYRNKIANGKLKFDNTSFKNKESYLAALDNAIANLNNGWDNTDAASLSLIGITPDFYTLLMSDAENPLATLAEISAKEAERKLQEYNVKADSYIRQILEVYNNYAAKSHTYTENNPKPYIEETSYSLDNEASMQELISEFKKLGFYTETANDLDRAEKYLTQLTLSGLREGATEILTTAGTIPVDLALLLVMPFLKTKFVESTKVPGLKYYNDPEDSKCGAILCYKDGKLFYSFIGNVKDCQAWQTLKANFDKTISTTSSGNLLSFDKKGGVLKYSIGGEIPELEELEDSSEEMEFDPEQLAALLAMLQPAKPITSGRELWEAVYGPRHLVAEARGMSYDLYNKKQRQLNGRPDLFNLDNGQWKEEDYVRLGAIAADIASIPLPSVYGAVAGAGGTMLNLWADWADDSVTTTELIKNLGMNLGMDVLSIIPVLGDAADAGRLTKNLAKMAPKIGYALSAYGLLATVKNGHNIMDSLNKVTSGEKLTVGDYQNIAQGIAALAGINGYVKGKVSKKVATKRAKVDDAIGLGIKHKGTGKVEDIILQGDKAKGIREAIQKGDLEAANSELGKLHGFDDYEVNLVIDSVVPEVKLPWKKNADGTREAQSPLGVSKRIDSFEIFDSKKLRPGLRESYVGLNLLNTSRLDAAYEAMRLSGRSSDVLTKTEVETLKDLHILELTKDAVAKTEQRKSLIELTEDSILGTRKEDGTRNADGVEKKYNDALEEQRAAKQKLLSAKDLKKRIDKARKTKAKELGISKKNIAGSLESELSTLKGGIGESGSVKYLEALVERFKREYEISLLQEAAGSPIIKDAHDRYIKALQELDTRNTKLQELLDWVDNYGTLAKNLANSEYVEATNALKVDSDLSKNIALYDVELATLRERLRKLLDTSKKSSKTLNLLDLIDAKIAAEGSYSFDLRNGLKQTITDIKDIINNLKLLKKGGRLQFLLQGGSPRIISGVGQHNETGDWTSTVGELTWAEILKRLSTNKNYYKTINLALDEHSALRSASNGKWDAKKSYTDSSGKIRNYQTKYLGGNWNKIAILPNYGTRYDFSGSKNKRNSGDIAESWTADNLYAGITDDRRLLGRDNDYSDQMVASKNLELSQFGLKLTLGNDGYWRLTPLEGQTTPLPQALPQTPTEQTPNPTPLNSSAETPLTPGNLTRAGYDTNNPQTSEDKEKSSINIGNLLGQLQSKVPTVLEAGRLAYLNASARKLAEHAKKAEVPYLLDPVEHHRQVYGNWRELLAGEKTNADLLSVASRPLTSDGALQTAAMLDARTKGQQYIDAGRKADDEMIRKTSEASWQLEKENKNLAHNIAMQNRLSVLKTMQNRNKIDNATKSEIINNINTGWQGLIKDALTKLLKSEELADSAALKDIDLAVSLNPNEFGANLTEDELAAYERTLAGEAPSDIKKSDVNAFNALVSASKKIAWAKQNQLRIHYKVPGNPWSEYATYKDREGSNNFSVQLSKDGSKLEVAKLRKKAKNADRFQKNIHKQLDSLDKKLDRISKSMYGYPKSEVIKSK